MCRSTCFAEVRVCVWLFPNRASSITPTRFLTLISRVRGAETSGNLQEWNKTKYQNIQNEIIRLSITGHYCFSTRDSPLQAKMGSRAEDIYNRMAGTIRPTRPTPVPVPVPVSKPIVVEEEEYDDRSEDETEDAMDESRDPLEESGATHDDSSDEEVEESVANDMHNFEKSFQGITKRYRLINRIGEGDFILSLNLSNKKTIH